MTPSLAKAYDLAKEVRNHAHAPYSRFFVGACFKVKGQEIYYTGCNVENASFGATVCAERIAIFNWVSQAPKNTKLEYVVLVTDTTDPVATPCGMCLQVMSEFVSADFPVHIANLAGIQSSVTLKDLLPMTFKL